MKELLNEANDMLLTEEELLQEFNLSLRDLAQKAGRWFKKTFDRGSLQPWGIYEFSYGNYKHDPRPLCIMFEHKRGRWYGINLHYMHPSVRAQVSNALQKVNEKNIDQVAGMFSELGFCFRSYLPEHISSVRRIKLKEFIETKITERGDIDYAFLNDAYTRSLGALS